MALSDRFEQAGIIVGSAILLALPMSELTAVLVGYSIQPLWLFVFVLIPGIITGLLLATDHLSISYSQLWAFSLIGWLLTSIGWGLIGLSVPPADQTFGFLIWVVALCQAGIVVWMRPFSIVRKRLGHTLVGDLPLDC